MAANNGDLVQSLIEGGLTPQAARIIGNVLANAASPSYSKGNDEADVTPTEKLRLIDADTRRYTLTNLDFSRSSPFQERLTSSPGQYAGPPEDHPYKDSQPVTSAAPLASPRVQGEGYVRVENVVEGNAAVSKVSLRLRREEGSHLRIDPSTKFLDAVNFFGRSETPQFLGAEFIEGEQGTELVISLRNLESRNVLLANGQQQNLFAFPDGAASTPADPFLRHSDASPFMRNSVFPAANAAAARNAIGAMDSAFIYQEGNWTPFLLMLDVGGGVQQGSQVNHPTENSGKFVRIGRLVHVTARVRIANSGFMVGAVAIANLPIPVGSGFGGTGWNSASAGSISFQSGFNWSNGFGGPPDSCYPQNGTNYCVLTQMRTGEENFRFVRGFAVQEREIQFMMHLAYYLLV
jgi:hypothetical protein